MLGFRGDKMKCKLKTYEFEAMQYTGQNVFELTKFIDSVAPGVQKESGTDVSVFINGRKCIINTGNWIIKCFDYEGNVFFEILPEKKFQRIYDLVDEEDKLNLSSAGDEFTIAVKHIIELNNILAAKMLDKCKTPEDLMNWQRQFMGEDSLSYRIFKLLRDGDKWAS